MSTAGTVVYHSRSFFDDVDPNSSPEQFSALTDVPLFLGYVISYLLQGILIVQIFLYFIAFPKDSWRIKLTVGFLFFVECLSTFSATFVAVWSIVAYGDLFDLTNYWGFKALGPLCGIASLTVHAFYSWRIWQVGAHWSIPLLVILLSIAQCVMVIWSGTQNDLGIGEGMSSEIAFVVVWLVGSALCDIIIAITLVILLPKAAQRVGTPQSISRVERLMKVLVDTGMITAFGALFELMFFFLFRNTLIHYILFYMLPKIYSNCMLAALNARIPARALRTHDSEWGSQQSTVQETNECSKIQVGDGIFHIVNCDGNLVPLEGARKSDDCDKTVIGLEDTFVPNRRAFVQVFPRESSHAAARTTALSHPLPMDIPRPLPQPELASVPIYRDSHPRSLPIPSTVVAFSGTGPSVVSSRHPDEQDPIPTVTDRLSSEPVTSEPLHPESSLVPRPHPFPFDFSNAESSNLQVPSNSQHLGL